jgi:Na+-driven multidrug efflux pump
VAAGIIMLISGPMISAYNLSEETQAIAKELILSISIIVVFQATNSIMTKGVLRGGGDTKVLMVADNVFLWVASIPLGILAGLVLHLPAFWIYFALKIDQVLKAVWCVIRLRSGKWIKKIKSFHAGA